jgi:hypothetical protein
MVAAAAAALALGGCSLSRHEKSIPPPPPTDTSADVGGIGTPITLRGTSTELEVTVTGVIDPLPASSADQTLHPGDRFAGVRLTLRNIGDGSYAESPLSDSKLFVADGSEADGVNLVSGPCGGSFPLHVGLRPGRAATGCVPFELGPSQHPVRFEFSLDSGFGSELGTWKLR